MTAKDIISHIGETVECQFGNKRLQSIDCGFPSVGLTSNKVAWCRFEGLDGNPSNGTLFDPLDVYGSLPGSLGSRHGQVDVARRARSLVKLLSRFGHDGITHPDCEAECEDMWSKDYAIICNAYTPDGDGIFGSYFDGERCLEDFKKLIMNHFACDPSVKITFHNLEQGSNEVEFERVL